MKNILKAFSLIAILFAAYSCTPEQAEAVVDFLGGDTEYTVPAEGGSASFDFECDQDWFASVILPVAELENDWFAVSGMHGEAGEGHVEVTLKENPRDTERYLEIQITAGITKSAKIKVTQLAKSSTPGGSIDEDDPSIDEKVEVLPYGITAKSVYLKGVVGCSAPAGYESTTPAIGFMISSEYKTVQDIYNYGSWYYPLKYKTTGDADNVYRYYLSNLEPATTYYVIMCAEYKNDKCYRSSKVYMFSTSKVQSDYNGHEYVDLGLSVKWAKCNVGAKDEYAVGGYYSWGETSTKSTYTLSSNKYYAGKSSSGWATFSKYVSYEPNAKDGKIDNIMALEPGDDAARAVMGGTWRTPHDTELKELINNCKWEREGDKAVKITGPNGNYIILPFGGNMSGESVYFANQGRYMGAELEKSDNSYFVEMDFTTGSSQQIVMGGRDGGLSLRAVTD